MSQPPPIQPLADAKRAFVHAYLIEVLTRANGNRSIAARMAGLDPANLRRLLRSYGLFSFLRDKS